MVLYGWVGGWVGGLDENVGGWVGGWTDLAVGLLELVQEEDLVRATADGLGQRAAFLVAFVGGWVGGWVDKVGD